MRRFALLSTALAVMLAVALPATADPGNNSNSPEFWEAEYPGLDCWKVEDGFYGSKLISGGSYTLVVVKGGPVQNEFWGVSPGDWIYAPFNPNSGKHYGISNIIYCKGYPSG